MGAIFSSEQQQLALAVALPLVGGWLSGLNTRSAIKNWYSKLNKPSWTPPNFMFPIAWTFLYACMGVASYRVYRQGGFEKQQLPLALYGTQLALNFAWTPLFFSMKKVKLALYDILALDTAIAACMYNFLSVDRTAGLLMVPYIAWTSYATALNYYIYKHNPNAEKQAKE
eukprot:GDKI01042737.1.p1 GENE.GDKI01042737.1~~GDKI01042737.1.p1  ORF type:complete len:170 (+),score=28.66 GDKI01042737.1:74-583(+)